VSSYPHPIIAREGWPFLIASVALALAIGWLAGWWWSAPVWLWVLFVLQFFRDPARTVPGDRRTVVAPADGLVCLIEEAAVPPELGRGSELVPRISIFLSLLDAHVQRAPVGGEVLAVEHRPGSFHSADLAEASADNERNSVVIRTPEGHEVVVVQIAGLIARRIICDIHPGQSVKIGDTYGLIRFGSRLDTYLPAGSEVLIELGQHSLAGETVLARLP